MLLFEQETDFFVGIWDAVKGFFVGNGWQQLLIALALLVFGSMLITLICWIVRKILYRTAVDNAAVTFFSALIAVALWIFLIFAVAKVLSISTSGLLVVFSSVALAVGLALKDSLANLANGILIIFNKPFKRGDHVEINGMEGIVQNIKLMTVELITFDNKLLVLPNSTVTNNNIINFTALPTRRVDKTFSVAYGTKLDLVEKILTEVLSKDPLVMSTPAPVIFLSAQNNSSLDFTVRAWTETKDYWTVANSLPRAVYDAFTAKGINIPYAQMDIHINNIDKKPLLMQQDKQKVASIALSGAQSKVKKQSGGKNEK